MKRFNDDLLAGSIRLSEEVGALLAECGVQIRLSHLLDIESNTQVPGPNGGGHHRLQEIIPTSIQYFTWKIERKWFHHLS
jgi:hypothetical protein